MKRGEQEGFVCLRQVLMPVSQFQAGSGLFSREMVQQTSEVKDTVSPAQPLPFSVWPHPHTTTMEQPGTCLKL